jgi:hypothetical protein
LHKDVASVSDFQRMGAFLINEVTSRDYRARGDVTGPPTAKDAPFVAGDVDGGGGGSGGGGGDDSVGLGSVARKEMLEDMLVTLLVDLTDVTVMSSRQFGTS